MSDRPPVRQVVVPADAPHQLAWLGSLGLPGEPAIADELAFEFDEGYRLLPQFIANGWLQADVRELLDAIDVALATMSEKENHGVWAVEALATDERWEEVRRLARSFLNLLT